MLISNLDIAEAYRRLVSAPEGISEPEARRRLLEFGPNEIKKPAGPSYARMILSQMTHFLAILLWIAAGLAFMLEAMQPGQGMLALGLAIVAVIVINASFSFFQQYKVEKALEAMGRMLPFKVRAMRQGREVELDAAALVPGDVINIAEGDKVPADARLVLATGLKVNNSSLTGESEPVERTSAPTDATSLLESANLVFAGTEVVSGSGSALVFATGMQSEFGRIAQLTGSITPGLSPLQREIIKITRLIAAIAVAMGVAFFFIGHFMGRSMWENFLFAVGIVVANVPEGLLPTVTLALAMGAQRMAKRKALIKNLNSVETLGAVTVICTDKTGTLTQNRMVVKEVREAAGADIGVLSIAALCNNAKLNGDKVAGEPTEAALMQAALLKGATPNARRIAEFPFDSDRKLMSTVHEIDGKQYILTKGAPEGVLSICTQGVDGNALDESHALMDRGLRVLGFCYREIEGSAPCNATEAECGMTFAGFAALEDPPRPEVHEALCKCSTAGIRTIMMTGDGARTARAIAQSVGLADASARAIEGRELEALSDEQLRQAMHEGVNIFARITPRHKLRIVSVLKDEGHRVAVTGDGVNDAPAIKKADIGIAMGSGTDVCKEAADMVLLDDNFATIVNAIEEGRAVYENIRKFVSYIFSSNIPEIVPYIAYVMLHIPLPLTIMQILAVDLGTDMVPALALGVEKPSQEVMRRPPRARGERLLSAPLLLRAYLFLGPIEAAAGLFAFFYVLQGGGWQWGQGIAPDNTLYLQATTACLTAIVITQVANVMACRSWSESIFTLGFFSNRLIFVGIAVELLVQLFIVYTPLGNKAFATHPITLNMWLVSVPFALALLLAEETRKALARRMRV